MSATTSEQRCKQRHPKFGRCTKATHDASKPTDPHTYEQTYQRYAVIDAAGEIRIRPQATRGDAEWAGQFVDEEKNGWPRPLMVAKVRVAYTVTDVLHELPAKKPIKSGTKARIPGLNAPQR
jgi:hypothetical protein